MNMSTNGSMNVLIFQALKDYGNFEYVYKPEVNAADAVGDPPLENDGAEPVQNHTSVTNCLLLKDTEVAGPSSCVLPRNIAPKRRVCESSMKNLKTVSFKFPACLEELGEKKRKLDETETSSRSLAVMEVDSHFTIEEARKNIDDSFSTRFVKW